GAVVDVGDVVPGVERDRGRLGEDDSRVQGSVEAGDAAARRRLEELVLPEGQELFHDETVAGRRLVEEDGLEGGGGGEPGRAAHLDVGVDVAEVDEPRSVGRAGGEGDEDEGQGQAREAGSRHGVLSSVELVDSSTRPGGGGSTWRRMAVLLGSRAGGADAPPG